jgi:hypothetical protein
LNADSLAGLSLATLPRHFRQLALWFVITLTVGYSAGLVFVAHTTSLSPKGTQERYRGNQTDTVSSVAAPGGATSSGTLGADTTPRALGVLPPDSASGTASQPAAGDSTSQAMGTPAPADEPEMKFEKSLPEMLNITHTHILAMTSFLAIAAAIFALSSRPSSRLKSFLIVEPFVAILTSFAAMWLMRYVHPAFSYLLMLSSGSFALCFYAMMALSFRELVGARKG